MKKIILFFPILVLIASNCTKQGEVEAFSKKAQKVYVYTSILSEKAIFSLYLNQDYIGKIPYIDSTNINSIPSAAMVVNIRKGKQELVAKDMGESFYSSVSFNRTTKKLNVGFIKHFEERSSVGIGTRLKENGFKQSSIDNVMVFRLD
jgi:hypothetical protein